MPNEIDPYGEAISITNIHDKLYAPSCAGGVFADYKYDIGFKAKAPGFIVQHIRIDCWWKEKCGDELKYDTFEYYEAFDIALGQSTMLDKFGGQLFDTALFQNTGNDVFKSYTQSGVAKFFYSDSHRVLVAPPDPNDPNDIFGLFTDVGRDVRTWNRGYTTYPRNNPDHPCATVGGLYSTESRPIWFDKADDTEPNGSSHGWGSRIFQAIADCECDCAGKSHVGSTTAVSLPRKNETLTGPF